jgi:hypothetical protein
MKTSIDHNKEARQNGYTPQRLSVKDAVIWFIITVLALCVAGVAHAKVLGKNASYSPAANAQAPFAQDITMSPIVQATALLPFSAISAGSPVSMFTVQTVPSIAQGILSIDMNGRLMQVGEGMMLSADLAANLIFTPDPLFSGDATFTYTASDEVERSADGKNFQAIATVTAKGNELANDYVSNDDLFFITYNTIYYRIKMVNVNGTFKYSSVVTINLAKGSATNIKAWPMPFTSNLNLNIDSEAGGTVNITIRSINGGEIMKRLSSVNKGNNTIVLYQAQNIPAGTYLLTISNGNKRETIKVVKQ